MAGQPRGAAASLCGLRRGPRVRLRSARGLGALGSHRSSTPPTSRWSGASSTRCPPPRPRTNRDGSGPRCRTGLRAGSRTRSPRRWPGWTAAVRPRRSASRSDTSTRRARPRRTSSTRPPANAPPACVFQATGAARRSGPGARFTRAGARTGLWLPDTRGHPLHLGAGDQVGVQLALPGGEPAADGGDGYRRLRDRRRRRTRGPDRPVEHGSRTSCPSGRATWCPRHRRCRCWSRTPTPTAPWRRASASDRW